MAGKGGEHAVNKISVQYDAAKVSMSTRNCHYAEGGSWLRECGESRPAEAISRDWRDPKCNGGNTNTHTNTHTHTQGQASAVTESGEPKCVLE